MTELRRWLETGEAPSDVFELLKGASPPRPLDARTRVRSRRRLAAMTAIPAAAGVVFWIKSAALGAILGGAVLAVAVVPKLRSERASEAAKAPPSHPVVRAVNKQKPNPIAADTTTDNPPVASDSPAPSLARALAITPAPAASVATPATLARETHLLEKARQLLNSDAASALSVLNQHEQEFQNGALQVERELLAVDALLRLGRRADARKRAAQLRARNPGSIYERRLSQLLGETADASSARFE